jgi:hypothetical protein
MNQPALTTPWRQIVTPHDNIKQGRVKQNDFAESLADVLHASGNPDYHGLKWARPCWRRRRKDGHPRGCGLPATWEGYPMYKIRLVCEGPTDYDAHGAFLDANLRGADYELTLLQPDGSLYGGDAGPHGGRWKGVRGWCKVRYADQAQRAQFTGSWDDLVANLWSAARLDLCLEHWVP